MTKNNNQSKAKKEQKENTLTEIAFILDRSGSMGRVTEEAITGFNEFLGDQQKAPGRANLTLVLFDNEYLVPVQHAPIDRVKELDSRTYVPRGSTALLDAIGKTIKRFRKRFKEMPKEERPDSVIFAIFTDGYENASVKYSAEKISKMITKRRNKDGWEFLFLAANEDAIATAAQMGIGRHDSSAVRKGRRGMRSSSRAFSRKISGMRKSAASGEFDADGAMELHELVREVEKEDE